MKYLKALLLIIVLANWSCSEDDRSDGLWIRVINVSDYNYENVVIYSQEYGNISANARSDYFQFEMAYSYIFVSPEIDNQTFIIQPIDYVGEQTLEDGYYSFLIDVADFENKSLIQTLVKDE